MNTTNKNEAIATKEEDGQQTDVRASINALSGEIREMSSFLRRLEESIRTCQPIQWPGTGTGIDIGNGNPHFKEGTDGLGKYWCSIWNARYSTSDKTYETRNYTSGPLDGKSESYITD